MTQNFDSPRLNYLDDEVFADKDNKLNKCKLALKAVLLDENGFPALIKYIAKEFSLEIMLFLIEATQFQRLVVDSMDTDDPNRQVPKMWYPENIVPESSIIHGQLPENHKDLVGNDIVCDLKMRAVMLFEKYIRTSAAFEINISFGQRDYLSFLMNNINEWLSRENDKTKGEQLKFSLDLFKPVIAEQFTLLGFSFTRFKSHASYKKLQALYSPNKKSTKD